MDTEPSGFEQSRGIDSALIAGIKEKRLAVQAGLSFMASNPQDSLRSVMSGIKAGAVGYGFGIIAAYSFDPVPIVVGGDVGATFFGGDSRSYEVPNQIGTADIVEYDIVNLQFPVTAFVRLQPNIETWVHPYVEGVGGVNFLFSWLSIAQRNGRVLNSDSDSEGESPWIYGVGAGLMVKFADIITLPNSLQRILIDVRFRYLRGSSIELPSISINDPGPSYSINRVAVNEPSWVYFNIGITTQF